MAAALIELAERCEAATDASKELDRAIFDAVTVGVFGPANARFWHSTSMTSRAANLFTASIDAARTLVPDGWTWGVTNRSPAGKPGASVSKDSTACPGDAATPQLALCAAALRARAAKAA